MAESGRQPRLLAGVRVGGLGRVTNPESTLQPAFLWAHQAGPHWSTNTARLVGTFELGAKVSSHATSPIAFHLLVACGTQRLGARLVDLPSSAAVQSLVSHGQINGSAAANLAVTWSLVHDHIVASGSADGVARLWNIRRHTKVHNGPVNGLTWTDDGLHEGTLIIRLRGMGPAVAATRQVYKIDSLTSDSTSIRAQRGERTTRNFLSSIVWRGTEPMSLMASAVDIPTDISVPGHPS
ncbi:hypothetical protein NEUTE2DRAFT_155192 [Neurospora tetrasperma FGSC 2509]|nr:hypothetical protein NEUTE2DRAFT_155192 [Neurospora tetrasperma FGSC 2509]